MVEAIEKAEQADGEVAGQEEGEGEEIKPVSSEIYHMLYLRSDQYH